MSPHQLLASCWTTAGDAAPLRGDERSPFAIGDRIAALAASGWQGFGINQADLEATRSDPGWSVIRSILDDYGISHVEVEFLNEWWTDDERRRSSDGVRFDLLAAAEVLRAGHIKVGSEFSGRARRAEPLRGRVRHPVQPGGRSWNSYRPRADAFLVPAHHRVGSPIHKRGRQPCRWPLYR